MFFRKITSRANGKEYTYLKLIKNYRQGNKIKQKVIANLGNIEDLTPQQVHGLIAGLSRICGVSPGSAHLEAKKVLRYGEVLALHKIWEIIDLSNAVEKGALGQKGNNTDIALLTELMAINQLVKPQNRQAIADWHESLSLTNSQNKEPHAHDFYNTLNILSAHKDRIEKIILNNLRRIIPINTELAFCRLTTGSIEPPPQAVFNSPPYSNYIMDEPEEIKRVNFAVMTSRDGMPLGHHILPEISGERDFIEIKDSLKDTFSIDRCIYVGDRNVLLNTNMELLVALGYEYLIGRKLQNSYNRDLIYQEQISGKEGFIEFNENLYFKEIKDGSLRYLLCYDLQSAEHKKELLEAEINAIEHELMAIQNTVAQSRKGFNKTALDKNSAILKTSSCRKYFKWHYNAQTSEFSYQRLNDLINQELNQAGIFVVETNSGMLDSREILESYTKMALLGESFRIIKSFETSPSRLFLQLNTTGNIIVCVLAAIMEITMERLLRQAGISLNTRQALELLEEIKLSINQIDSMEVKSITKIAKTQEEILQAIGVEEVQQIII